MKRKLKEDKVTKLLEERIKKCEQYDKAVMRLMVRVEIISYAIWEIYRKLDSIKELIRKNEIKGDVNEKSRKRN